MKKHFNATHGMCYTSEYQVWVGMRRRCYDRRFSGYRKYGAKGIIVCDRWLHSFENFIADMGIRPAPHPELGKYSIDRIDSKGNYTPDNCTWSHIFDQNNNRGNIVRLTFNGQTITLLEWEKQTGINGYNIAFRIKAGWSVERALTTPVRKKRVNGYRHL